MFSVKKLTMRIIYLTCILLFLSLGTKAQYATKKISKKEQAYIDSLKQIDYPYLFPIWGQKVYQRGFDIPYPVGIMTNFMWLRQGIVIENMQLGLKSENYDVPLTATDFIDFGDNLTTAYTANIRPDLWIFPFLNVYGLFGYGTSETEVNLVAPIELNSVVNQNITTLGVGLMGAFGIGPLWLSVDWNNTWNKPELLEKAVRVNVLGLRLGHTFKFKNKPERNFALWAGGMRANMSSETKGEIKLSDALPQSAWDRKDQIVADYGVWRVENYDDLTLSQKLAVDNVIDPIVEAIDSRNGESIIRYGMDKRPSELWNGVVGAQFQLNKRWMFRTEVGLIGDRKSFLASANYRFLW
jgi:hypothetical protein